ncbi:MAG: type I DNA topoisomerase [Candidatus Dadabacteria bacterium]|nr:type I DNA topoisomerase [Candidatus Dadabacteria bacterium]
MSKSLIIVESPAKAKTIKKYLGEDFNVEASSGHLIDLPTSKLGVDIDNDFNPEYVVIRGKAKYLDKLKKAAKNADKVYLASDPDREGEAIAWHIANELNIWDKSCRVLIHEITKSAVKKSIENPTDISQNRFEAQQARRVLDRLVGYQVSPLLWRKVRKGLSAGRVQSVALRLVVEREREIEAFKPREYWSIESELKRTEDEIADSFVASLAKFEGEKVEISKEEQSNHMLDSVKNGDFIVSSVDRKDKKRNALPPFITSTLQQEASRKIRFGTKKTMSIAQKLYEGIELGEEGPVGLITYMRTDSVRVSNDALVEARSYIKENYGDQYLPATPNTFKVKKSAQDAHEAIRPTFANKIPDSIKEFLSDEEYKLYKLIWQRFLASQMNPIIYDQTTLEIEAGKGTFRATGSIIKFPGFSAVYLEGKEEEEEAKEKDEMRKLPDVSVGDKLDLINLEGKQHFTQPPPRFSESSLVKELEEKGIGRPSTYASIISTIQDREYVLREKNRLSPTVLGRTVNDLLIQGFPEIMDVQFTADMEEKLDDVEDGNVNWVELLRGFYDGFADRLDKAQESMKGVETNITCDNCSAPMIIKWGKNGEFLSCSRYPDCKNAKAFEYDSEGNIKIVERAAPVLREDIGCDKCSAPMVIKQSRRGEFLACSRYPDCKNAKAFEYDPDGNIKIIEREEPLVREDIKCEKCGKPMAERKGRFGKFVGCTGYPKCRNIKNIDEHGNIVESKFSGKTRGNKKGSKKDSEEGTQAN